VRTDYRIIGVAPPGLAYPAGVEYWVPMWSGWHGAVSSFAVARLAPGATVAAARDEYFAIENRLTPKMHFRGAHAATFTETILGDVRPVLALLTTAVALLLLIACLNVGNLLLLRASTRARSSPFAEHSARASAIWWATCSSNRSRSRAGAVLGLLVAIGLRLLVAYAPANLPRLDDVQLAGAPIAVPWPLPFVAVLLFGVVPALLIARGSSRHRSDLDARVGEDLAAALLRQTLVASQMALAMVMLGGAALLTQPDASARQDTGFVTTISRWSGTVERAEG
jgi:hypothetical protein